MRIETKNHLAWIRLDFKPQDFWIGAYWTFKKADYGCFLGRCVMEWHLYVCLLPCLPIHFSIGTIYVP